MSIFHFDSIHETTPLHAPSKASDAILIEHVLSDPDTVPGLERQFGPELLAMTTEVAKAVVLEQLDKSFPRAVEIEKAYKAGKLIISRDFTASNSDATNYGENSDPFANIQDTLIAPVRAKVGPRDFTEDESKVVDAALKAIALQGRTARTPITELDPDVIENDTSIMISGRTARPGYSEEARDLMTRRAASRTLRAKVANALHHIPGLVRAA